MINIFIVNLKSAKGRKKHMEEIFKPYENISDIKVTFIEAVDKKNLTNEDIERECTAECHRSYGEIACALSHRKIYKKIIDEQIDFAFILEDDVNFSTDYIEAVRDIYANRSAFVNSFVKLDHDSRIIKFPNCLWGRVKVGKWSAQKPLRRPTLTQGYALDLEAAKTFFKFWPKVSHVADEWGVYSKRINLYCTVPRFVFPEEQFASNSCIGDRGWYNKQPAYMSEGGVFAYGAPSKVAVTAN